MQIKANSVHTTRTLKKQSKNKKGHTLNFFSRAKTPWPIITYPLAFTSLLKIIGGKMAATGSIRVGTDVGIWVGYTSVNSSVWLHFCRLYFYQISVCPCSCALLTCRYVPASIRLLPTRTRTSAEVVIRHTKHSGRIRSTLYCFLATLFHFCIWILA